MARQARYSERQALVAFALIALVALLQRHLVMANPDVAWLLTVGDKSLDGARLYIDLQEINPPASIWLYLPFVILGRLLSVAPERLIDIGFLAAGAASAWSLGGWPAAQEPASRASLRIVGFAILALLPAACFGQREHAALILFVPLLALARIRGEASVVAPPRWLLAGFCIGLVIAIKPHFALAVLALYGTAAWQARKLRPLLAPEMWIGAALVLAYGLSTIIVTPAFWRDMMPILTALYLPSRLPIGDLLNGGATPLAVGLVLTTLYLVFARRAFMTARSTHLAAAALAGFLAAAVLQGKGYPYHFYPAFGLLLLLTGKAALDDGQASHAARWVLPGVTLLFATVAWLLCNTGLDTRPILARMRAIDPHPRMASLASDLALGFPAVRELQGVWIGRGFSRWIPQLAEALSEQPDVDPKLLPVYRALAQADRRGFAEDVAAGRPRLILAERRPFDFLAWAREDAQLAAILACYEVADRVLLGTLDAPGDTGLDIELLRPRARMTDPARPLGCKPD